MKKLMYGVLAFAAMTFTACGGAENTEVAETKQEETKEEKVVKAEYTLDQENSTLEWKGSWVGGKNDGNSHYGPIDITSGTMHQDGEQYNGHFTVDMTSFESEDLDVESGKDRLENRLSSDKFFNVEEYAVVDVKIEEIIENEAKVVIVLTGVEMKRTLPIEVSVNDDVMTLEGEFTLDVAEAGIAGMQVNPEKPEEGAVSTEIEFKLHAELKKK